MYIVDNVALREGGREGGREKKEGRREKKEDREDVRRRGGVLLSHGKCKQCSYQVYVCV